MRAGSVRRARTRLGGRPRAAGGASAAPPRTRRPRPRGSAGRAFFWCGRLRGARVPWTGAGRQAGGRAAGRARHAGCARTAAPIRSARMLQPPGVLPVVSDTFAGAVTFVTPSSLPGAKLVWALTIAALACAALWAYGGQALSYGIGLLLRAFGLEEESGGASVSLRFNGRRARMQTLPNEAQRRRASAPWYLPSPPPGRRQRR